MQMSTNDQKCFIYFVKLFTYYPKCSQPCSNHSLCNKEWKEPPPCCTFFFPTGLINFWIRSRFLLCKRRNDTNIHFQFYNNVNYFNHRDVAKKNKNKIRPLFLSTSRSVEDVIQSTEILWLNVFWKICWQETIKMFSQCFMRRQPKGAQSQQT